MVLEYAAARYGPHADDAGTSFDVQNYVDEHWSAQYKGWQQGTCRACGNWLDTMTRQALQSTA